MDHERRIDVCRRDEHGIDLEQLEYNLSLTPDQRLRQLMGWVEFIEAVRGKRGTGEVERNVGLLARLNEDGVPYVIVGEVAAIIHGATLVAQHLEVCASLSEENAVRIIRALRGLNPKWRMRPDLPVVSEDSDRLRGLKNMYLRTDRGQIDIVGELPGVGGAEELVRRSVEITFAGIACRVLDIEPLIQTMQFSGRDKDRPVLTELKIIREKLWERGAM